MRGEKSSTTEKRVQRGDDEEDRVGGGKNDEFWVDNEEEEKKGSLDVIKHDEECLLFIRLDGESGFRGLQWELSYQRSGR